MPSPERRGASLFAVALLGAALIVAPAAASDAPPSRDASYHEAISTILCDCGCHPQSVEDCACGRAAEMRGEIAALADRGMSGEAIVASYVEEHGEQIRIAPTATGFNLVAWLGPIVLLVLATGGVALLVRRLAARGPATDAGPAADRERPAPGSDELERLDRALEDWS